MVPYVQLSTYFRIGFWHNENKICSVIKLSCPQMVDNCTYGIIAFQCIKSSLALGLRYGALTLLPCETQRQNCSQTMCYFDWPTLLNDPHHMYAIVS